MRFLFLAVVLIPMFFSSCSKEKDFIENATIQGDMGCDQWSVALDSSFQDIYGAAPTYLALDLPDDYKVPGRRVYIECRLAMPYDRPNNSCPILLSPLPYIWITFIK